MRSVLLLLLIGCGDSKGVSAPPDAPELPVDTETEASETDTTEDEPTEPEPEETEEPQTPPVETDPPEEAAEPTVRFVAMGDGGEGNDAQYAVGEAVQQVCAVKGCEFVLYLGDNFYDDGVYSVDDEQFDQKFELPYENLDIPFMVSLGNHDFGEIPLQFWRTDYQVDYTQRSAKWTLPDHFYTFESSHATFISLDTNMIMLGLEWTQNQGGWLNGVLAASSGSTWRIAYGHHPYRSNGRHGNAGNYEGAWFDITGIVRGDNIKDFFEDRLCGQIDVYLCGHDHNRQWLEPACGIELIVTGAASKTTDLENRDNNPTIFEDDQTPGFTWIELVGDTMNVEFYDMDGQLNYSGQVQK